MIRFWVKVKIKLKINDKDWGPETKKDYKKNIEMFAIQLAKSINNNPEKFTPQK